MSAFLFDLLNFCLQFSPHAKAFRFFVLFLYKTSLNFDQKLLQNFVKDHQCNARFVLFKMNVGA